MSEEVETEVHTEDYTTLVILHSLERLTNQVNKEGKQCTIRVKHTGSLEEIRALRKDYEFGVNLSGLPGIAEVLDWQGTVVLEHLEPLTNSQPMALPEFMRMAIQISEAVAGLHERNIVHNAISPR